MEAVTDVEPGVVASAVLVAHQRELGGGGVMVDGASLIGAVLQSDARHEGWGGFVEVVVCCVWRVGVVADAPSWAVGGWRGVLLAAIFWSGHGLPLLHLRYAMRLSGESEAEDELKREGGWLRENRKN